MIDSYEHTLVGACHCHDITLTFHTDKPPETLTPRACQCGFCQKHGAAWIADPEGKLVVSHENWEIYQPYQFGHKTCDFMICQKCGVLVAAICEIHEQRYAVMNTRLLKDQPRLDQLVPTNFNIETLEERLDRRRRNWIGVVDFAY